MLRYVGVALLNISVCILTFLTSMSKISNNAPNKTNGHSGASITSLLQNIYHHTNSCISPDVVILKLY